MKKQLTKLLAFVLSVCMVVGMIPAMRVGVRADESVVDPPENVETQSGDEPAAIDTDTLEIWVAENGNGNGKSADSPIGQFVKNQNSDTASTSAYGIIKNERTATKAIVHVSGAVAVHDNLDFELLIGTSVRSLTIEGLAEGAKLYVADDFNNGNSAIFKMNSAGKINDLTLKSITLENTTTARDKYCIANWGGANSAEVFENLILENVTFNGRATGRPTINYYGGLTIKGATFNGGTYNLNLSSSANKNITNVTGTITVTGTVTVFGNVKAETTNSAFDTTAEGTDLHLGHKDGALSLEGGKYDMTATVDKTVALTNATISGTYTAGTGLGSSAMFSVTEDGTTLTGKVVMDSATKNLQIASGKKVAIESLADGSSVGVTHNGSIGSGSSAQVFTGDGATQESLKYVKSDSADYVVVHCDGTNDTLKDGGKVSITTHTHAAGYWLAKANKVTISGANFTITGSTNCETHTGNVVSYLPVTDGTTSVTLTAAEGQMFDPAKVEAFSMTGVTLKINEKDELVVTFDSTFSGSTVNLSNFTKTAEAKVGDKNYAVLADALKAATSGNTVTVVGSTVTPVTDQTVASNVTIEGKDGGKFTTGADAKVSVDSKGSVTLTGGTATVDKDGSVKTKNGHEVSADTETTVTVTVTPAEGAEGTATEKATATATDEVTIDGVTFTGATEYDLDDPFGGESYNATVPANKAFTLFNDKVNVSHTGEVTVKKESERATVSVLGGDSITVGGKNYNGPITIEIDKDGNVKEIGPDTSKLTLQRDADGKIATNGQSGVNERLQPKFTGAEPGTVYYWRINGEGSASNTIRDPDGGVWYTATADGLGNLILNEDGSKTLVYGDYVEITGNTVDRSGAKKVRLLSKELLNGGFESVSKSFDHASYYYGNFTPRSEIYGWRTSASPNLVNRVPHYLVQLLESGGRFASPWTSGNVAELNGEEAASLYQEINTEGQKTFAWSLDYAGRGDGQNASRTQMMAVVIGPVKEDGQYQKPNANTDDMFQTLVKKLTASGFTDTKGNSYTAPTQKGTMTGPYYVKQDDTSEAVYTIWVMYGVNGTFTHFADTIKTEGRTEMVFAFTAVAPATGSEGNLLDNVMFQKPDPVYMVGGEPYATLEDAIKATEEEGSDKTITINDPSLMGSGKSQTGTLPSGVTLKDKDGNTYTGSGTGGAEVSVDSNGNVTVLGGEAKVNPASGNTDGASFGVQGQSAHDVTVSGESTVTVTTDEDGKVTGATVAPTTPSTPVEIDGVTYTGPSSGTVSYDVDDPFTEAPDGTKATIPESKAADSTFKGLTVPGKDDTSTFTVKPATGGGDVTVTKGADGNTSSLKDASGNAATVNGTVGVAPEGKVTVNGTTYTVPAAEDGEVGSAKLGLVTVPGSAEGEAGKDVVELLEGAVNVPQGKDVYVNGKQVQNSAGTGDITVTKDMPGEGQAQVDIPAGSKAKIGDTEFTGKTSVVVDADGSTSIVEGTAVLGPKSGEKTESVDVTVKGTGTDGATSGKVTVTNPDESHNVTVKVPVSETNPNGQATVPAGGSVTIQGKDDETGKTYKAAKDTVLEFDEKGDVSIASGAVELADGNSVGFGSVTLGNDATATNPASSVTVEVVTPADGEGAGKAKVTVPKGETFTVTDKDGKEHTYKNNGEGNLTLTVDEDGKVTVEGDLPTNGVTIGEDTPITFKNDDGTDNTLTGGKQDTTNNPTGGATLKPNTRDDNGKNTPLLSEGSVTLPDEGGKVNVTDPTATGDGTKEKRLEGKNVEVYADSTSVKSKGDAGAGRDGEVTVEQGTTYYIPDGEVSSMNNGTFGYPAKGEINENKDGPGSNPFVLKPDEGNGKNGKGKLYTDNTSDHDTQGSDTTSNVVAQPGAAFDIYEKADDSGADKDALKSNSLGHYEGAEPDGASLTVEHANGEGKTGGEVTLRDGSVTMTKGSGEEATDPSVYVDGVQAGEDGTKKGKVTGDGITVTTTHDDTTGKANGADVTVPKGKSVDIDGKKYNATEGDLELHIDDQGKVTVKKGTVKLDGTDDTLPFGDTSIKGSGNETPNVTVTIPASDGSENAKVEVAKGGEVTIGEDGSTGGKTYKNAGEGALELEVTPKGKVELKDGSVTLPTTEEGTDTSVGVTAGDKHYDVSGDGVTVTTDGTNNPTAKTKDGGDVTVTDPNDKSTTYTAPTGKSAEVELTDKGPALKNGAVELDAKGAGDTEPKQNESIVVNGVTVEATQDGTEGKVTVEKDTDGNAKVTVPAGGKANVNGVEVTGKADVTIDKDGVAHIDPGTDGVELNGKTYKKKPGADENSEIVIGKDGKIEPTPASAFIVEIDVPTEGPVHVGPGETLTFKDKDGKDYSVTGGDKGGYFTADEDGNITVTDVNGTKKAGPYKDAGTSGLKFTVNDDVAALDDGTVKLADGETVGFGDAVLGNNKDGKTTEVTAEVPGGENEPEKSKAKVTVPNGETFTVTDKDGKTHTYKNNGTGDMTLWVDKDGNVTVKDLPTGGLTLGAGSTVTVADEDGDNGNTMTAGDNGATLKKNDTTKKSNPPKLTDGSVILPSDEDATVYVDDTSVASGNKEKELKGRNVEVFASVPADEDGTGGSNVKIKGADKNGGEGEVTVQGGTRYSISAGDEAAMNNASFSSPAKGVVANSKDGLDDDSNPANNHFVLVPGQSSNKDGLYSAESEGTNSHVFAENGAAFDIRPKKENLKGDPGKAESNLDPSIGHYEGVDKGATLTVDHSEANGGEVTLNNGSVTMTKGEGSDTDPSLTVEGIPGKDGEDLKITGDNVTVTKPRDNGTGADVKAADGEVTIDGKTYKNEATGEDKELGLYVDENGNVGITKGTVKLTDEAGELPSIGVTAGSGDTRKDYDVSGDGVTVVAGEKDGDTVKNTKATVPAGKTLTVTDEDGNTTTYDNAGETEDMVVEFTENGPKLAEGSVELNKDEEIRVGSGADGTGTGVKNTGAGDITVHAGDGADGKPTVDIPAGGSVELDNPNGYIEAEGDEVEVELGDDGSYSVKVGPGESVTVNGKTYTNTDTENDGTITVKPDGTVETTPEGKIDETVKLPAKNLKIPEGKEVTYTTPDGKEVKLKGGEGGGTVDIDASGNVTGKAGNTEVRGDVKASVAPDAEEGTTVTQYGDVTITVTDENGNAVEGAGVEVKITVTDANGNKTPFTGTTGSDGTVKFENVPYGTYSVTVTDTTASGETYTTTGSVTVDAPEVKDSASTYVLYGLVLTTKVESDLYQAPAVGGLTDVATEKNDADVTAVDVTLKANELGDRSSTGMVADTADQIKSKIQEAAGDLVAEGEAETAITDYIDVTVEKTVTTNGVVGNPELITSTPTLLTLSFKISSELAGKLINGVTPDNIFVIRQHGDEAKEMRKVSERVGKTASFECYYIQVFGSDVYIVIRARNFSVYAFGVAAAPVSTDDPSTGGISGYTPPTTGVTVPETEHGTVVVSPEEPKTGDTVTLLPVPDTGCVFDGLTVTDSKGNKLELTDNGDGTYSFTMPADSVTVSATFHECPSLRFPDLDVTKWYHQFTDYVIAHAIMNGYDTGLFLPEGTVTRAEMVTVLWHMAKNAKSDKAMWYTDVAEGEWYYDAIAWATEAEVVNGYEDDTFRPDQAITREEMAVMLYRYEKNVLKGGFEDGWSYELTFPDKDKVQTWSLEAMSWCAKNGLFEGDETGLLKPNDKAERAALAKILTVYMKLDEETEQA